MAAGRLGGAGVSTMEPARPLLAAGACGERNAHACHGPGSFSFTLLQPTSQHGDAGTCAGEVLHRWSELGAGAGEGKVGIGAAARSSGA